MNIYNYIFDMGFIYIILDPGYNTIYNIEILRYNNHRLNIK